MVDEENQAVDEIDEDFCSEEGSPKQISDMLGGCVRLVSDIGMELNSGEWLVHYQAILDARVEARRKQDEQNERQYYERLKKKFDGM